MAKDDFNIDPKLEELNEKWLKNPQSRAFAPLADAYRKSGMLDEALNVCLDGLKIHPDYISAHIVLGKIYLDKQMVSEAAAEFNGVIEKDPDNLVTLNYLGDIYYQQKRFLEALEKYERAKKLDPFNEQLKQRLTEVSRFCSQPVSDQPARKQDRTPQPGAVDLEAESASPEVEEVAASPMEEFFEAPALPTAEPMIEPEIGSAAAEPEAEEPEKVFEIEAEPAVSVSEPESEAALEVTSPEAEEVHEVEPEAASASPEAPSEESEEKIYDIGEEVEPLDKIEFPPTPLPDDEEESGAEAGESPSVEEALPQEPPLEEAPEEEEKAEEPAAEEAPPAVEDDKVYQIDSELVPLGEVDLDKGKGEEHEVATLTMARIYAKQGMINKARVICLKLLSQDPGSGEAKELFTKLQDTSEGEALRETPPPAGPRKVTPAAPLADDEPLIDFREESADEGAVSRAQTIFVGDLTEEEEAGDDAYRGTVMDVDCSTSDQESVEEDEKPQEKDPTDMEKWLNMVKEEEEDDH